MVVNLALSENVDRNAARVTHVRFEHLREAIGIGTDKPRLSWRIDTQKPGWTQDAYEIEFYNSAGQLNGTSGMVKSGQSVLVEWPFAPLASRERRGIRVRVRDIDGEGSEWSETTHVETGLLKPTDWSAQFITPAWDEDTTRTQPCPFLRREFRLDKKVNQARLYITSLGAYEAEINGQRVGDQVLAPGWTSYDHHLAYQTFDVTGMLHEGPNAIGAILGEGWFRGRLGFGGGRRNIYGERLALLAQLEVTFTDESTQTICTDSSWRAATGPVLSSEIYDGEKYDARLEQTGWSQAGFEDASWSAVRPIEHNQAILTAPMGPPVRRMEVLAPVTQTNMPSGRILLDFGQNLVGHLRLSVQGPAGQTITLRHAEVLENGELSTRPLRHARATDTYILKETGLETWEPRFTYHGFRYAEVSGWPGELKAGAVAAVVCHSDMERTGWFECSDELVNRLHQNVVWSMRGNFFSIPTDCPQRDERLGWTGDIQVFSPTASFLFDSAGFLGSWLADLAAEQAETGGVAFFVPGMQNKTNLHPPAAAWGDAAVVVPWVLYQHFADSAILERQFDSMKAWVEQVNRAAGKGHLWDTGMQFGDWLDPAAPPDRPGAARTPPFVVATAYFARSAELVGQAARVLGRKQDEDHYIKLARDVRKAFNENYVTPAGRILGDSATAYTLALQFALLPEEGQRRLAGTRLVQLLRANRYRINTGFVGTPIICDALSSLGEYDAAYRLLMTRENPSWLYPVMMGATTIWERWDSLLPDGSVNPGEMTSFNHYALGSVADWLHRTVAGLAPAEPGYKKIEIRPIPGGGLTHASARLVTPYGLAKSAWNIADGRLRLDVTLPPNTTGTVTLPGDGQTFSVACGHYTWSIPYQPAEKQVAPLSLDMSIGELIDRPEAYNRILGVLYQNNHELSARLEGQVTISLRQAAAMMPNPQAILAHMEKELAQLQN